jgi:PKD repeat protein
VIGQFSSAPSGDSDAGDKAGFTYSWSFGDGALSGAVSPAHAYATAGIYDVTLTVTDPSGLSDTHTAQVNVATPGQPDDPQDPEQPQDPQSPRILRTPRTPRTRAATWWLR